MGKPNARKRLRDEIQSTWTVYEPRVPGTPFTKKDLAEAEERAALGEPTPPVLQPPRNAKREHVGTLDDPDLAVVKR